jgi:hypothetical protein
MFILGAGKGVDPVPAPLRMFARDNYYFAHKIRIVNVKDAVSA